MKVKVKSYTRKGKKGKKQKVKGFTRKHPKKGKKKKISKEVYNVKVIRDEFGHVLGTRWVKKRK